jgi:hypothetical protein
LKRLAFLANSDFHKPKHIYSWKTLLHCHKDPEAIKDCIRKNEQLAITLYRDGDSSRGVKNQGFPIADSRLLELPSPVALKQASA